MDPDPEAPGTVFPDPALLGTVSQGTPESPPDLPYDPFRDWSAHALVCSRAAEGGKWANRFSQASRVRSTPSGNPVRMC